MLHCTLMLAVVSNGSEMYRAYICATGPEMKQVGAEIGQMQIGH